MDLKNWDWTRGKTIAHLEHEEASTTTLCALRRGGGSAARGQAKRGPVTADSTAEPDIRWRVRQHFGGASRRRDGWRIFRAAAAGWEARGGFGGARRKLRRHGGRRIAAGGGRSCDLWASSDARDGEELGYPLVGSQVLFHKRALVTVKAHITYLSLRFSANSLALERGYVEGDYRPSDRTDSQPRSCNCWSFYRKPLQIYEIITLRPLPPLRNFCVQALMFYKNQPTLHF